MASKILKLLAPSRRFILKDVRKHSYSTDNYLRALSNLPRTYITTLDKNGARIASENNGSPVSTVGLWVDSGTRYENEEIAGVSHCLEHLLFSGTSNRGKSKLEEELDKLGVQLKGKSGREHIALYANCLTKDVPKVVEILGDILNNYKITDEEFDKVKSELLLELKERGQDPKKVVMDHLHNFAYQQTPLSLSKVGTTQSLNEMTKQTVLDYARDTFLGPRVVLACSGGVEHEDLVSLSKKYLEPLRVDYKGVIPPSRPLYRYTGGEIKDREDDMQMAYYCLAVEAPGWEHKDHIPMQVAQNLLGKWDMTHAGADNHSYRLAHYYQDKQFSVKKYETFYKPYQTTGLFGVYQVSENHDLMDLMVYFQEELVRLTKNLFDSEVAQAKNVLRYDMLTKMSNTESSCKDIGVQVLRYNGRQHADEVEAKLSRLSTEKLQNILYEYIYDRCPVVVGYGHLEALPEYNRTRTRMFQIRV